MGHAIGTMGAHCCFGDSRAAAAVRAGANTRAFVSGHYGKSQHEEASLWGVCDLPPDDLGYVRSSPRSSLMANDYTEGVMNIEVTKPEERQDDGRARRPTDRKRGAPAGSHKTKIKSSSLIKHCQSGIRGLTILLLYHPLRSIVRAGSKCRC